MYKQCKHTITGEILNVIQRIADQTFIPFDPANTDYQEYLRWCEQGNTPLPADEEQQ